MAQEPRTIELAGAAEPAGVEIQMAPLIDIVFLLICFYLLVAQLIEHQEDPAVVLPAMASPGLRKEDPAEFVINLRQDGVVVVGGRPTDLPALRALLAGQLNQARQAGQPLRVVIRADRRQRYGKLDEVLKACRGAGVRQIVFRTLEKDSP